jgi:hypothetical protein
MEEMTMTLLRYVRRWSWSRCPVCRRSMLIENAPASALDTKICGECQARASDAAELAALDFLACAFGLLALVLA